MASKRKVDALDAATIETPSFMAGALEFRSIRLMTYLDKDCEDYESIRSKHIPTKCQLCSERNSTHYIWEANVGKLIGADTCHVFMCGRCVTLALYSQRKYIGCAGCKKYWPVPSYSIKLADGKDSSLLCQDCHLNGGHRQEMIEAIKNLSPKIKLNKSM